MSNVPVVRLALARAVHTLIYLVMSGATLGLLYIGMTGRFMAGLWIIVPLLAVEIAVFGLSGLRCPMTAIVDRYAGPASHVADTYLPEALTRHTLAIFGPVLPIAFMLLSARLTGLIGQAYG
ncbi:hypothetical protein BH10PSE1_BH10PSE1_30020 [soil metagenome]